MKNTPTILARILDQKRLEVQRLRSVVPESRLQSQIMDLPPTRGFHDAIYNQVTAGKAAVIAEIKKASPSKGVIRADFHPGRIAANYQENRATCLSVLTDEQFFQGSSKHLIQARGACNLPVLRKDFIIDSYQVFESRVLGADCILLIVAALTKDELKHLYQLAIELDLDVLIEVHNRTELVLANTLKPKLIGVNNRDLHTFNTRLATTIELLPEMQTGATVVTESGIHNRDDINLMIDAEVRAFLVGEAFMRADQPGEKLGELFAGLL